MHTSNIWNKLHLHRIKILTTFCLFIFIVTHSQGQNFRQTNLPDYDNRTLHFGFTVGGHTSTYKLKYNDQFNGIDSLHSIVPNNTPGFSIGFLANFHLLQYLDVRPMFKVAFYEFPVDYNFTDGSTIPQLVEAAYVELPLLVKYRSLRRRNFGMYLVGGVSPGIQVGGRLDNDTDQTVLHTYAENLQLEYGLGLDIYYPLFKFSPEIRVSHGMRNMMKPGINDFTNGIERISTHTISLYLLFQ